MAHQTAAGPIIKISPKLGPREAAVRRHEINEIIEGIRRAKVHARSGEKTMRAIRAGARSGPESKVKVRSEPRGGWSTHQSPEVRLRDIEISPFVPKRARMNMGKREMSDLSHFGVTPEGVTPATRKAVMKAFRELDPRLTLTRH
jgi:hypothetical protein